MLVVLLPPLGRCPDDRCGAELPLPFPVSLREAGGGRPQEEDLRRQELGPPRRAQGISGKMLMYVIMQNLVTVYFLFFFFKFIHRLRCFFAELARCPEEEPLRRLQLRAGELPLPQDDADPGADQAPVPGAALRDRVRAGGHQHEDAGQDGAERGRRRQGGHGGRHERARVQLQAGGVRPVRGAVPEHRADAVAAAAVQGDGGGSRGQVLPISS